MTDGATALQGGPVRRLLPALVVLLTTFALGFSPACSGDDDADSPSAVDGGRMLTPDAATAGGTGGTGGLDGGSSGSRDAGGGGGTGGPPVGGSAGGRSCAPVSPAEDACLACITSRHECCGWLASCGTTTHLDPLDAGACRDCSPPVVSFGCYDGFFTCVRDCFEDARPDGSVMASVDIVRSCGEACASNLESWRHQELSALECAVPALGVSDTVDDAGIEQPAPADTWLGREGCARECFDGWL